MTTADRAAYHPHPAPARGAISLWVLFFGLAAGPTIWIVHLVANAILAAHGCAPGSVGRAAAHWSATRTTLVAVDIVALSVTLAAAAASLWCWRTVRQEHSDTGDIAQVGEGRTRFIAICGLLASAGFAIAILFDTFAAVMVPQCSS